MLQIENKSGVKCFQGKGFVVMRNEFTLWLRAELDAQGWKQADLARATGLSSGAISNVLNGQRQPSVDFVLAVARALRVSPEDLYRRAGLLPPKPEAPTSPLMNEALDVLRRLPTEKQQEALNYLRYLYKQELGT
jgi:transcriptional regulator with XRE-family HTH domain